MRPVWVAAAAIVAIPWAAPAAPDDHVQLVGTGSFRWNGSCEHVDILLLVERLPTGGYGAKLEFVGPGLASCFDALLLSLFPASAPFFHTQTLYVLEGSWESGFVGRPYGLDLYSPLWLGPYRDGRDIEASGYIMCALDSTCSAWSGAVSDARLVDL